MIPALARLSLRLRVALIFAGLGAGVMAALALGLWAGWSRAGVPFAGFAQAGLIAGFAALGLIAWVWFLFDQNVARPTEALAAGLRARAHTQGAADIDTAPARYLGDLAPAAAAATTRLAETQNALAEAVARETVRLADEKDRLETLLSDVAAGVVLVSGAHLLAFYNGTAAALLGASPGLDRPLFNYLHEGPIRHAHDRLMAAGEAEAASDILCTTVQGARVLSARMRLLGEGDALRSYVLTFRDVTADIAAQADREALLADMLDRIRRPAAALTAILGVLPEGTAPPAPLEAALRAEARVLGEAVSALADRQEAQRGAGLIGLARASDLVEGVVARLRAAGLAAEASADPLILRCNGFEVIALAGLMCRKLAGAGEALVFRVALSGEGSGATLRLHWQGAPLPIGTLDRWLAEPVDPGLPGLTGRAVLTAHATDIWPETSGEGRQALCLPLTLQRREGPRPALILRAVVYDFDLLSRARGAEVADTRLADLTAVVFDTETTGLLPDQGDEIVQIAALRIVNGRRLAGEVFDTLVNPGRPIPARSTAVHGITEAMVADAPPLAEAGRAFHHFAQGAVLVAHNAPFDMAFLRRHEPAIGAQFDHPVLDTVLLSAVVFGQSAEHTLDALTHRLGITIPDEARHTALGDALATADAFLRLIPMLEARGLATFGQVLAEVRRHGRLLKDMN